MTTRAFPSGAGPAPPLRCDQCRRRIGKTNTHLVHNDGQYLLCVRCHMAPLSMQRRLHTQLYPDCPHTWHDLSDHHASHATRAVAWFALTNPQGRSA